MESKKLISLRQDKDDGRLKLASFLPKGKKMHDLIIDFQLEREQAFLSVLNESEIQVFIELLNRTRANLPNVEVASGAYVRKHWRSLKSPR